MYNGRVRIRALTISRPTSSWREEQGQRPVRQRAGTLRYMGPPRPAPLRNRPAGDKCSQRGKPSQANRGPKKRGRSGRLRTALRNWVSSAARASSAGDVVSPRVIRGDSSAHGPCRYRRRPLRRLGFACCRQGKCETNVDYGLEASLGTECQIVNTSISPIQVRLKNTHLILRCWRAYSTSGA